MLTVAACLAPAAAWSALVQGSDALRVLAVATGLYGLDVLKPHQPDWAVRCLNQIPVKDLCRQAPAVDPDSSHASDTRRA